VLRDHANTARRMADFYRARYANSCEKIRAMRDELDALRTELDAVQRVDRDEVKRLLREHMDSVYRALTKR